MSTTHNTEGRRSCTCREKPKIGPSLETSKRQHDYSGMCLRQSLHVIFKMLYAEKDSLSEKTQRKQYEKTSRQKTLLNTKILKVHILEMNASRVETPKEVDVPRVWDISLIHVA